MTDPRIDPLTSAAILTDTQMRLAFAPQDPDAKVVALTVPVRNAKLAQMQSLMQLGRIHLQVKAGFGEERSIELSGPELMVLIDMADRFVTELPRAQQSGVQDAE